MRNFNYWERLKALNLKSLQRRREVIIITHIWKIKYGIYPNSFDLTFKVFRRTGAEKAMLLPLPRIGGRLQTLLEESFLVKSCKLWNVLPASLTHIDSLGSFKHQLFIIYLFIYLLNLMRWRGAQKKHLTYLHAFSQDKEGRKIEFPRKYFQNK